MKYLLFFVVCLLFSVSAGANDCAVENSSVLEVPFERVRTGMCVGTLMNTPVLY